METHKKFKIEQNALRIYVFAIGVGITIYCAMLCFGVRHWVAETVCVTFGYLLLCGGAWMFRLCWLSWAFILYTYAVRVCIILYPEGVFDGECCGHPIVDIAHHTAFTIGAVLTIYFISNIKKYYKLFCQ